MSTHVRFALIGVFALVLGLGLWKSFDAGSDPALAAPVAVTPKAQTVKLLTGSAKFAFLQDEALTRILAQEGITLDLAKTGAFEADVGRATDFDAVWPAGSNVADDFAAAWKAPATYPVFSTPLALATWKKLLPVFSANGLTDGAFFSLDRALPLMLDGKRWNQLKGNDAFKVNKGFLVNTPDIRKSNTGAVYISALAYILNGQDVPADTGRAQVLAEELSPLITRQGFQEGTLAGPFEDYIGQGMGKAPLVLIYESQFVEAKAQNKLREDHVLLYPEPGLVLKHTLVARSEAGKRLGVLLSQNPEIQAIAARYGFRTNDKATFDAAMTAVGLQAPELNNLASQPSSRIFDAMRQVLVNKIEGK